MTRYLNEEEVARLIAPEEALAPIEASFERLARGVVTNEPRRRFPLPDGTFAVMSAVDEELGLAAIKAYTWLPGGTPFVVVIFDLRKSELAGVLEADTLGQLRTGAASGVAAKYLARPGAATLGVIGCGFQAETQVACIRAAVPTIEHVVAYCRTRESLEAFCRKSGAEPARGNAEAADADIVVTVTTSKDPVLRGEWLREGALVCAVGANDASKRELDNVVIERAAFVCCDSVADATLESGDLIDPVAQGLLDWQEVHELQGVVAGTVQGRSSDTDIVVFKSNGIAAWDLAIGAFALRRAREREVGREL